MFSNFIEAKKYFENMRFQDWLLGMIKKYPSAFGISERDSSQTLWINLSSAFIYSGMQNGKLWESMVTAGIVPEDATGSDAVIDLYENFELNYYGHSFEKYLSPEFALELVIAYGYTEEDDTDLIIFDPLDPLKLQNVSYGLSYIQTALENLLFRIDNKHGSNLLKIATAYFQSEYDPIQNYKMTQVETPNITKEASAKQGTDLTVETTKNDDVYGFNSPNSVPSSESTVSSKTTGDKTKNITETTESETGTRTLTREGNIGVTTSQQMLESELKLRRYDFVEALYKAFDDVLMQRVY